MTRHILIPVLAGMLVVSPSLCRAQHLSDSLSLFLSKKKDITYRGMYVLGGWAALNLGSGLIISFSDQGRAGYFFQMNALWGATNLIIATSAIRSLNRSEERSPMVMKAGLDLKKTKRLFLVNAGLDCVYMATGYYLTQWSKELSKNSDRVNAYGNSFIIQGAFLFGFDMTMYFLHRSNGRKRFAPLTGRLSFYGNGMGFRFG